MSDNRTTSKGKKNRKWKRNEAKCAQYRSLQLREKHKVKRILLSSGWRRARAYATWKNVLIFYNNLIAQRHIVEQ